MTNGDGAPDGTPDGAPDQPVQAAGQGRLARVLATRGGKAAPEAPFVIEHREALIYMLCEAAELEHGIMCQYLFAAFSLKQAAAEGLTPPQLAAVTRWRKQVSHVATQEMLHLALVHNLLSAIGAAPHLARPNLPQPADHYPAGVQLALLPFGEQALRHFMFLERPEGMDLQDAEGMAAVARAEPMMSERDIVPRRQDFATVGHLYRSIEAGIAGLVAAHGEDWLFVGPPRAQATQAHFRWPELVAVTDAASAQRAIDTILEQGEGPRGDWRNAHFGQFVAILDEYEEMTQADPAFDPVRPVVAANVRPPERAVNVPLISDPLTARVTDLFNVGYEVLLQIFERYFAHTQETDVQLKVLADATVALMLQVIKPLGDLITTLPVGPDQPGSNAGPSFELFYETDYLMPHRDAAWALLTERLDEAAWLCEALREGRGAQIGQHLEPVLAALRQIARTLAAHLPAGSAQARQALQPEPLAAARIDALTAQADVLARGVAGVTRQDEMGSGLAAVFDLAHAALTAAAGPWSPGHVAPRLADSVLRPLADALARYPGEPGVPAVGVPAGGVPAGGATAVGATAVGGGQPAPRAADELVWQAAQAATRLLARLGVADSAPPQSGPTQAGPPELAEATAALQELACGLAPAPERAGRLATLRQLQSALPALIQTAKDGPYLVTNVPRLLNYLGEPVAATPQVALCRCGGSSMKPLCDGTHARIGFSDVKDPKRVPDRRDSYVGQQVTILDNRGLCQHSGYCTDRLPAAFRTGQEPFVAPSGGRMDEIIRAARDCPSGALSFAIEGREERDIVDWGGQREPAIEVTRDGPYRITGGIMLVGADGIEVERNAGASREHCALCRCGHSQNKPFCSGMHWYVGFRDPVPDPGHEPTLFEWAGGLPALTRMTRLLYEKHVPADDLLAPLFASMPPEHPRREAMWLAEVFGGPAWYSADRDGADRDGADRDGADRDGADRDGQDPDGQDPDGQDPDGQDPDGQDPDGQDLGGPQQMTVAHAGRSLDERQRARWVALASRAADEAGLPADAQFRSAFAAYLDWGSRVAVGMSQPGSAPAGDAAVPRWGWTAAGPPDTAGTVPAGTVPAGTVPGADQAGQPTPLPGPGEAVSFGVHIKPLFRASDRQSMSFAFDLWSCGDVRTHAADILDRLRGGSMPCDGAWPGAKVDVFQRWVDSGMEA